MRTGGSSTFLHFAKLLDQGVFPAYPRGRKPEQSVKAVPQDPSQRNRGMEEHKYERIDFDNPSFLFVLEDKLKGLLGCPLYYGSYFRSFGLRGDEKILDFGCGGGAGSRCLLRLLSGEGRLTCVDISDFWIKRAKRRLSGHPNVDCRSGDIRTLDIPESAFDVIYTIYTIHDIEPSQRQEIIDALSSKIKPGGLFFVREPTKKSHGMAVLEIQTLMSNAGLKETRANQTKSEYRGTYQKPTDT
jgi:SAM-dependent methyltransferase